MIRIKKKIHPAHQDKINMEAKQALHDLEQAIQDGCRVVYLDELCTTKQTILKADWSARR